MPYRDKHTKHKNVRFFNYSRQKDMLFSFILKIKLFSKLKVEKE